MTAGQQSMPHDLQCPNCGYSLRGLPGPIVDCPECGLKCDIVRMITRRWRGPWTRAPGYTQLMAPVAILAVAPWLGLALFVWESRTLDSGGLLTAAFAVLTLATWVCLMIRAQRNMPNVKGFWLALLAHVLFAGYLTGLVGVVWAGIWSLMRPTLVTGVVGATAIAGCGALLVACRRGERFIASRCICQDLIRDASAFARSTMMQ